MPIVRALSVIVLLVPLAACFVHEGPPAFDASAAQPVDDLEGLYDSSPMGTGKDTVEILSAQSGYDYVMIVTDDTGDVQEVTLRAIDMGAAYLMQMHDGTGNEPGVAYFFATVDRAGLTIHLPSSNSSQSVADSMDLKLINSEITGSNDPDLIAKFLGEVAQLPLAPLAALARVN